jgi:hypothetical protein
MLFQYKQLRMGELQQLLARFETVKVLVYLRRQDSYLTSFYNSLVRNGQTPEPFEQFCRDHRVRFEYNLAAWGELVGHDNVTARPFDRRCWRRSDILADFLHQVAPGLDPESLQRTESTNPSLPLPAMEVLWHANSHHIQNPAKFRAFLRSYFTGDRVDTRETLLTPDLYQFIRERYAAENRRVAERYFAPEEVQALAFEEAFDDALVTYRALDTARQAELLVTLWNHLCAGRRPRDF